MNYPSVRQLRHFLALVEHQHFARAASASNISQSAFSASIQGLEQALDAHLVDRTNRRVTITSTGSAVATQARLCIRDLESLMDLVAPSAPMSGSLILGVIPTIAPFLLPRLLPKLRKAYPDLELYLIEDQTEALHARLLQGGIDAMLMARPYDLRSTQTMDLYKDNFMLAAHRSTSHLDPENYRFNRLDSASVLLLEQGHCMRNHALEACRIRDMKSVNRFSATSLLTLVEMVDADLGVTFLPEMTKGSGLLKNTRINLYPLKEKADRIISLCWRKGSAREQEFRMLGEFVQAEQ
jgi:LysR family hydrogen peroxide-inducible transcriptional activator